jgi:putative nucleotidyltransferase with HDIG domain
MKAKEYLKTNRQLFIALGTVLVTGLLHFFLLEYRAFLNLYLLVVVAAAYFLGRKEATMTAFLAYLFSVILFQLPSSVKPEEMSTTKDLSFWLDLNTWGCFLILTGYAMGTLFEHRQKQLQELRETYYGILEILTYFLSKDEPTRWHCWRTSVYAKRIAEEMGLDPETVEDIRAAALLHDIGKLDVSAEILHKAAKLTPEEIAHLRTHVEQGGRILAPVGGSLKRVIPLIINHHERMDGSGYFKKGGDDIPLGARVIAVADTYDAMVVKRVYQKQFSSEEARTYILNQSGKLLDPQVVCAFDRLYQRGEMQVSEKEAEESLHTSPLRLAS